MPDEVESNGGEVSDALSENDLEYDENDASLKDDDKMPDNALKQESGPDGEVKKKYDPKDPMRPRRKKARRACFACQRAHLTCGMPYLECHGFPCLSDILGVLNIQHMYRSTTNSSHR